MVNIRILFIKEAFIKSEWLNGSASGFMSVHFLLFNSFYDGDRINWRDFEGTFLAPRPEAKSRVRPYSWKGFLQLPKLFPGPTRNHPSIISVIGLSHMHEVFLAIHHLNETPTDTSPSPKCRHIVVVSTI